RNVFALWQFCVCHWEAQTRTEPPNAWPDLSRRLNRCHPGDSLVLRAALVGSQKESAMTSVHPGPGPTDPRPTSDRPVSLVERILYPEGGPIVAGGIAAAALALVLHAFALAIGLSVS